VSNGQIPTELLIVRALYHLEGALLELTSPRADVGYIDRAATEIERAIKLLGDAT
jgi:hypothetical protein